MKLLLDTADSSIWEQLIPEGYWSGITTNPLLLARANLPVTLDTYRALYTKAMRLGVREIHFQVFGDNWFEQALSILDIGPEVFVKIPAVSKGFKVAAQLNCPARVTFTAVYSTTQVMAAEATGSAYAAPYFARLQESGANTDVIFRQIAEVANTTTVLVASLRTNEQIEQLAGLGFSCFAVPSALALSWLDRPLALAAINDFESAAKATP